MKQEALERLKEILTEGDTLYTIVKHVSRSGMYRVISVYVIRDNEPRRLDYLVSQILEGYDTRHDGCRIRGAGMDMGFHLVYSLAHNLFGDGYKLTQKWL